MLCKADWNVVNLSDLVTDFPHADTSYRMIQTAHGVWIQIPSMAVAHEAVRLYSY